MLFSKVSSFLRMFKKVKGEGKARCGSLKMVAKKERHISAWLGGSIVASMGGYEEQLITVDEASAARKKRNSCSLGETDLTILCVCLQYDEDGPESVHRLNVLAND